ncbi:OLC1v1026508C1 [Oldenlandia corymbosa var. corymbosa]|uniref:OLC1v1026508C1 n=1 Tax=Oldenlandia corymbosa var. corymbosa TaxID=529605 RepID=A0AAV1C770_OLDCO|nr:OLC1v1026508C1 [Oldenlandia corymbosa var. corymbosa]
MAMMSNGDNCLIIYLLLGFLLIHYGNGNVVKASRWLEDQDLSVVVPAAPSIDIGEHTQYYFMSSKVLQKVAKKKKGKPAPPPPRTNKPGHFSYTPPPPRRPPPSHPPPVEEPYKHEKGTTTLGHIFNKEWIMVAVDHSSLSSADAFPENIIKHNSHLLVAFSGGSENSREFLLNHLPDKGPSLYKVDGNGKLLKRSFVGTGSGSTGQGIFLSRFFFMPGEDISMVEAVEVTKSALCIGAYNAPESREYGNVFLVDKAGITPVVFNEDITEWQKQHFSKAGREWQEPQLRKTYRLMSFF